MKEKEMVCNCGRCNWENLLKNAGPSENRDKGKDHPRGNEDGLRCSNEPKNCNSSVTSEGEVGQEMMKIRATLNTKTGEVITIFSGVDDLFIKSHLVNSIMKSLNVSAKDVQQAKASEDIYNILPVEARKAMALMLKVLGGRGHEL